MTGKSAAVKERLGTLSSEQRELLKLLREQRSRQSGGIVAHSLQPGEPIPASWAQERMWFIDQLEGGSAGYQVPISVRLRGALDERALKRALDCLVARHDILRTVFVNRGGEPEQHIAPEGRFALQVFDLGALERDEREESVRRHKLEEVNGRFVLSTGPLIRGRLLRLGMQEHVLLLTMHHIIIDGWSKGVLVRELVELYSAFRAGKPNPLPLLTIQYADYALWQRRQWQRGPDLDKQLHYWRTRLQGATHQLELPTDRPRPVSQNYRGENVPIVFDAAFSARLKNFAKQHDATLFMLLYTGLTVLLARLSGQDDIAVGTPFANRQVPEVEGLIGLFVNPVVLRAHAPGQLRVRDLLLQLKETTLGAYSHAEIPFEKVVEALQPQRSLRRNPLFQVVFVLHNWPRTAMQLPGLRVSIEDEVDEPSILDLWIALEERDSEIVGSVNYPAELFDRRTIERWMSFYKVLLDELMTHTDSCIGELSMLPADERDHLVRKLNATAAAYPKERLIHELFEEQVARTPDAIALVQGTREMTYAELNLRAGALANYLKSRGLGPDRVVGLFLDREIDMVVAALGILKSGAAYVPLDPCYPQDRLQYTCEDAAPAVLLTQAHLVPRIPSTNAEIVALDRDWDVIAQERGAGVGEPGSVRPHQLAYVIYTSGSTGRPKGVAIEHRNAVNLICWARDALDRSAFEHTLFSTSLNFDLSIYECFVPLSVGGTVHIVENALALLRAPAPVTLINTVPSAMSALLEADAVPASARIVNLAGEALKGSLVDRIFQRTGVEQVCNLYGPTETTTYSTGIAMSREGGFVKSIGRPIANTQIYLLNEQRALVPQGVIGEIYIAGDGVARGYLNRPDLTTERFLPDPFSTEPGARMYKTGDLGRWHTDGTLEYLGRNDHQVKIRGFRIELGEIEAQLMQHGHVAAAVVIAREDSPGEQRLVAYVTPRDNCVPDADALRDHLRRRLPEYMIPAAVVTLERFPLTSNGKLDRGALPAPDLQAVPGPQFEAPRGELEEFLARIWSELLSGARVGRRDDFFALGGHSLMATRVITRISHELEVDLPLRALFERPTIAGLGEWIEQELSTELLTETP